MIWVTFYLAMTIEFADGICRWFMLRTRLPSPLQWTPKQQHQRKMPVTARMKTAILTSTPSNRVIQSAGRCIVSAVRSGAELFQDSSDRILNIWCSSVVVTSSASLCKNLILTMNSWEPWTAGWKILSTFSPFYS